MSTIDFDEIQIGVILQTNVNFVRSHCDIFIGENGHSGMSLKDIYLYHTIPGSIVFYSTDVVTTERAIENAAITKN